MAEARREVLRKKLSEARFISLSSVIVIVMVIVIVIITRRSFWLKHGGQEGDICGGEEGGSWPLAAGGQSSTRKPKAFQKKQTEAMEVFIALTPHHYEKLCDPTFRLVPEAFGPPDARERYVPLKMTPEQAVKAALDANVPLWTRSAQEATEWKMVKATFTDEVLGRGFREGVLRMKRDGFKPITLQYFDDDPTTGATDTTGLSSWADIEVEDKLLDPTGLGSWADGMTKMKTLTVKSNGSRASCSATEVLLRSAKKSDGQDYCVKCWNDFFKVANESCGRKKRHIL